jgi:hypothetical protein
MTGFNYTEIENAWQLFTRYAVLFCGPVSKCVTCNKQLVTEEVSMHIRNYHPKEAAETLALILARQQWERDQLTA